MTHNQPPETFRSSGHTLQGLRQKFFQLGRSNLRLPHCITHNIEHQKDQALLNLLGIRWKSRSEGILAECGVPMEVPYGNGNPSHPHYQREKYNAYLAGSGQ